MKALLAAGCAIGVIGLVLSASSLAQQDSQQNPPAAAQTESDYGRPGWGPGPMMGPGMMAWGGIGFVCDAGGANLGEWRIGRIERLVRPTESQRASLTALRDASAKAAEMVAAACPKDILASVPARLETMEKRMEAMLAALKTVRPAFDAFYATLSDEQKARLNAGRPGRWGWHMRRAY